MKIKILAVISITFLLFYYNLFSMGTAGEKASRESRFIVDMPTAGKLALYDYSIYSGIFSDGGILLYFDTAPFDFMNIGLSFSGVRIIGNKDMEFQEIPGVNLKFRVLDETESLPAFALGFTNQGRGAYSADDERFVTISPGAYFAMSKNYKYPLGTIAIHAGVNYSFEPQAEDRAVNFYAGLEQSIGAHGAVNVEFNPTLNDKNTSYMEHKGLLNMGLRWSLADGVVLELQVRDLLGNINGSDQVRRSVHLDYIGRF